MIPWTGLLLSSFLLLSASTSHAARRLMEPSLPSDADLAAIAGSLGAVDSPIPPDLLAAAAAGSIPNLPPGTNLTALAESVPDETKAEYLSSMGNGTLPTDLPAQADLSALLAGAASSLRPMDIDIPDMPNVEIPDLSLPPIPQPTVSIFGHEFRLPLADVLSGGGGH